MSMTARFRGASGIARLRDRLDTKDAVATETDALKDVGYLASGAGLPLVAFVFGMQKYLEKMGVTLTMNWFDWVQCTMALGILVLTGLWIHNGRTELGYLRSGMRTGHFKLKSHTTIFFSFILLALFFAILAATTGTVHWFFAVYAAYLLFDVFLWRLRRREIEEPSRDTTAYLQREITEVLSTTGAARLSADERQTDIKLARLHLRMLEVLLTFYYKRPHIRRVLFVLAVVLALEMLAILVHMQVVGAKSLGNVPADILRLMRIHVNAGQRQVSIGGLALSYDGARTAAYCIFAVVFVISEYVLWRWRDDMRRGIVAAEREIDELEQEEAWS